MASRGGRDITFGLAASYAPLDAVGEVAEFEIPEDGEELFFVDFSQGEAVGSGAYRHVATYGGQIL